MFRNQIICGESLQVLTQCPSNSVDLVLDPFAGSDTTAVAAALSGRDYLSIELEQKYCQLTKKRLAGVARYCA